MLNFCDFIQVYDLPQITTLKWPKLAITAKTIENWGTRKGDCNI